MANLNLQDKKFITPENLKLIINYGLGFASRVKNLEDKEISPFEANKLYTKDSLTIYDGYIYKAKVTNQSSTFNEIYWDLIGDDITELTKSDVEAMVGLSAEEIETLSKIILDSEIRLDKTFSSSKIYTDIQNAIQTSKDYTLTELSKMSGASYKVVTSTSEMISESIIYLLPNATNYDMYIVEEDGTVTKIGDTTINLDNYYTKTEITDNYYDKATCDGKFATITTVDGKVDKTSILSASSSTATDEQVYSAFVMNNILSGKCDVAKAIDGTIDVDTVTENIKGWCVNLTGTTPNGLTAGWFENEYVNSETINQKFISYAKVMYIRSMFGGTWSSWQKICTTSIADTSGVATITNGASGTVRYKVINGTCYVSVLELANGLTGGGVCEVTGLPKTSIYTCTSLTVSGAIVGELWAREKSTTFQCNKTGAGGGYISFSYPIEES